MLEWGIEESSVMEKIGETSRGYCLYIEPNEVGGHRYWSDSIGGGVFIWDTSLASIEELEKAIKYERERLSRH